ncbi:AsmA-like C-terminal region-containing protein [Parasediminibacterium sp. JCM 36343]|uniref:AsmA-like C-terminal region-containing protein n=1 Tax=Parasediminibacterium sp. JCM 36343 TaxID=3374279 RepID=UPI00397E3FB3
MVKKILKIIAIVLLIVVVAAAAIPFIFKGKIIETVKTQINKNLNAKVDFTNVDLSLFRHFPKLSVDLHGLQVVGNDQFSSDTLLSVKSFDVSLDLMSVISGGQMKIYTINLDEPRIHAIALKDGSANWNITKPSADTTTTTTESKPFKLNLQAYAIHNGYISYIDKGMNMNMEIVNLEHSGKGDFTSDLFTLSTKTTADTLNFSFGGVPYLNKIKTSIDLDITIDNPNKKYTFETDKIALNALQLSTGGYFQFVNDTTYGMDIHFKAPSTDFKNILSFVPAIYQNNFASIKTSGSALLNGFVKGNYNSKQIPAYQLNLEVKDGFFQYPELPEAVKNINFAVKVDNPDGVTDHTVIDVPQGHIEMAGEPFDFKVLVKNPVTDMYIDAAAKGRLDLSKVTKFVKLQDGTQLAGLLTADASMNGNASTLKSKQYDKFNAKGTIGLGNFFYASKDYPSGVKINNMLMTFNPQNVTLSNMDGQYMKTTFAANGYINNLIPYALKNEPLEGVVTLKAGDVNLNELMGVSTDTATKNTPAAAPFLVPANLNLTLNAVINKVVYDNLILQNLSGAMQIADETVKLNNIKGNALDGQMAVSGYYSTKLDKKKPDISLTYNLTNVDIQKTFYTFNTVQKIMPVGQYLGGKVSSQFTMKGKLGDNMMPDMNSLSGNGDMLLIQGVLSKFAPVAKVAQTLNINQLTQDISLKDLKGVFEFANGKVLIKPFNVKVKDIDMEIGGLNGFDKSIDYTVNLKLPRSLMGTQGNNLINNLASQAASKGVPVKLADIVNLQVKLGGFMNNPTVKTDLKQAASSLALDLKQQVTDFAQAKIDSTKKAVTSAVKDTIAAVKQQLVEQAKTQLANQLLNKKDSTGQPVDPKKTIEEAGKGLLKGFNPFKKKG